MRTLDMACTCGSISIQIMYGKSESIFDVVRTCQQCTGYVKGP